VDNLCFKGEPNERGEVEIGYGTYPDFQNRGIMSEAIAALTEWAFGQEKVRTILAETEKSNAASARTLEKNNFRPFYEIADRIWWRKDKQPSALSSQL
jgi:[ribosomal protein S5]-alanine N-acetyltransferase